MISARKVFFKDILSDISLEVEAGGFVSIIGPNGAGKSTFLKCLNKQMEYDGEVLVGGVDIKKINSVDLAKKLAFVSQLIGDDSLFTLNELMEMSLFPYLEGKRNLSSSEKERRDKLLEDFEITSFKNKPLGTLSGGERQRAFIASAIFQNSDVLLLDEPTSALDPRYKVILAKVLAEEKRKGKTILCVTHDINLALQLSDKILALKSGRSFFFEDVSEVLKEDKLSTLFETKIEIVSRGNKSYVFSDVDL